MAGIGISYTTVTGTPKVYDFQVTKFSDGALPRSYGEGAQFSLSANGTSILSGAAFLRKRIWAISTPMSNADAANFDEMFTRWEQDRGTGAAAAIGLVDTTFGSTVTTSAIFSTAPSFSKFGHTHMLVSFGLTEV